MPINGARARRAHDLQHARGFRGAVAGCNAMQGHGLVRLIGRIVRRPPTAWR